jgi:hypothetical protein
MAGRGLNFGSPDGGADPPPAGRALLAAFGSKGRRSTFGAAARRLVIPGRGAAASPATVLGCQELI